MAHPALSAIPTPPGATPPLVQNPQILQRFPSPLYMFLVLTQPIVEKETENFKSWPRLHGFWRTLPNFNLYTVTSDPGQDLADEVLSVLIGGQDNHNLVCINCFYMGRSYVCPGQRWS